MTPIDMHVQKNRAFVSEDGFTLLEMMVVILIIGLIASMVVPDLLGNKDKADQKKVAADVVALENALDMYRLDNGQFPDNSEGLDVLVNRPVSADELQSWRPYIKRLPQDPWHHAYRYSNPGAHGPVDIYSYGSDNREGGSKTGADIGNWNVSQYLQ